MDRAKRNKVHRKNLRTVELAFNYTSRAAKDAIRRRDQRQQKLLTLNSAFLLGAVMENRLMAAISEPKLDAKRELRILRATSMNDMWRRTLQESFSQRYGSAPGSIPGSLGFTDASRYAGMLSIIDTWIDPVIAIRNSLAHGQWDVAFKSDSRTETSPTRTGEIKRISLWSLLLRKNLLDHWELLVFDLAVTKHAFERDFDRKWKNMKAAEERLKKDASPQWEATLRKRYLRGQQHHKRNSHKSFLAEQQRVLEEIRTERRLADLRRNPPWASRPKDDGHPGATRGPDVILQPSETRVEIADTSGWPTMTYSTEPPF